MKKPTHILRGLLFTVLTLLLLLVAANFLFLDLVVDAVWHHSLGYLRLFLLKIGYKYLVLGVLTLGFFLLFFLNFWVAARYLGVNLRNQGARKGSRTDRILRGFRTGSIRVYTPVALLLAVLMAMPLYREWEHVLLWVHATPTGARDALFGLDVTFYLFSLPLLQMIQGRLLLTLVLLLASLAVVYAAEMRALSLEGRPFYRGARMHLSLIVLLIGLTCMGGYGIEALSLQYSTGNEPLFHGPGHVEIHWVLPAIGLSAFFVLLCAICGVSLIQGRRGFKPFMVFLFLLGLAHLGRNWTVLMDSLTRFWVKPNELNIQRPHLANSIEATLRSYQLDHVERRDYSALALRGANERNDLENIPLWDSELLADVFRQLQQPRQYYTMSDVDVARYRIDGVPHQVYLAARELDTAGISLPATGGKAPNEFILKHLLYTHGYGGVMVPAAQPGDAPMRWMMRDMPLVTERLGFVPERPSIYYGTKDLAFSIAPNRSEEFHHPGQDDDNQHLNYQGTGGVLLGNSPWKKLVFALYFKDYNLFFTRETLPESRIHFRRGIQDRIRRLTPFLELDQDPYLVAAPDRFYWIQDAYTRSAWYPNAVRYDGVYNYIRNSVKIVVDAYDGGVSYYLSEPGDPIARAYQRMYPGLIRPLSEMPSFLREQVRYPRDLFEIQMGVYSRYHQRDPSIFYMNEDRMQFAEISHRGDTVRMQPAYLTLDLIQPGKPEFLLLTPMLPANQNNLRALAVAGCDPGNYGRIVLYTFPKGRIYLGPPQVNALIDQNTEIAQSITLWNQQGSEVKRGKMIVLPMKEFILYIQPLYMEATTEPRIPQLMRVILCAEQTVVMDATLEGALAKLRGRIALTSEFSSPSPTIPPTLPLETSPDGN